MTSLSSDNRVTTTCAHALDLYISSRRQRHHPRRLLGTGSFEILLAAWLAADHAHIRNVPTGRQERRGRPDVELHQFVINEGPLPGLDMTLVDQLIR
jgi:hypothetical protein